MNTKLIALVAIAAGTVAAVTAEVPAGATFEVPADQAEKLLTDKLAKLAEEPLGNQAAAAKTIAVKTTRVRVLSDSQYGKPNDVADIPTAELKQAKADGAVDDDKAAIAYALSLKG
jgi:hypothetical protein